MGFIEDFYIGGIAGIASKTALAPVERIRMMRINYPDLNFFQISKHIYLHNNLFSFFFITFLVFFIFLKESG